jgi:hypothetical protein
MRELVKLTASAAREVVHLYFDPLRRIKGRLHGRGSDDVEVTGRIRTYELLAEVELLRERQRLNEETIRMLSTLIEMEQHLREEQLDEDKSPEPSVRRV